MLGLLILLQATVTVAVPTQTGADSYLPVRIAESAGYFAQEQVQVVLREVRAEADAAEALAKGQVDLAATSLDAALRLGHTQRRPPRLVFGLTVGPPVALLVPAGRPDRVGTIRDLRGKTVGMPSPGSPEHGVLLSLLDVSGLSPRHVSTASFGERGLAAALGAGEVQAALIGEPWVSRLLEEGKAIALADLRSREGMARWLRHETIHAAIFVRAKERPSATDLAAFCRALLRAIADIASGKPGDPPAGLAPGGAGSPADWTARIQGLRAMMLEDGRVTPGRLEASIALSSRRAPFPAALKLPRGTEKLLVTAPLEDARRTLR